MTVADLIAELQKHDPAMRVLVDGYEGGWDDPVPQLEQVHLNDDPTAEDREAWYMGRHGVDGPLTQVLVLSRRS
jgi:hypothetical protein